MKKTQIQGDFSLASVPQGTPPPGGQGVELCDSGCCRKRKEHSGYPGALRGGSPCATTGSEPNSEALRQAAEFRGTDSKDCTRAKKS